MLVEITGSLLIMAATSYVGWQVAGTYARRPRHLRDLQTGLAVLQTEIEYGGTPLPEALVVTARAAGPAVGPIFQRTATLLKHGGGMTAGEALKAALGEAADHTALTDPDHEVLLALAAVLGSSGRQDQVRHLQLARQRLAGEEARAEEHRARYERLARYLGVLSGAALVLIFL